MKITFDKVNKEPFHSLTKKDIKFIFDSIPEKWFQNFDSVRLSNMIHTRAKTYHSRPVHISMSRLIIHSRGYSKENIIREVLIELAQESGDFGFKEAGLNSFSKIQLKHITQYVQSFLETIMLRIRNNIETH